ncbi:carboxypeptidase regulatory-like domain-containing protein [Roseiconus nitratireducens]|uniref:Carboxypeptidase regulatory-like domain-containing protein n=1 Tax=Roseiconus nitratireducens TaxID=2605748 RepID=A0A5M6D740_9BACT|nr:CehA/McbA family metallohydrolase [Roseiconus nitratireducens]KAA5542300.1 carboxypeptidase regulatory-like domain-containing protein [Roseiconus nitratireducens]
MESLRPPSRILCLLLLLSAFVTPIRAAELTVIDEQHSPSIDGKEVDWIYGDYMMKNDQITLVIAAPTETRDANLTIRDIGASLLDLTLNKPSNDQFSAYTPTAGRYLFQDPSKVETETDGSTVVWRCQSSKTLAGDGTTATVTYQLSDGSPFVHVSVVIRGDQAGDVRAYDGVRADRTFSFDQGNGLAMCSDPFFRQTIAFLPGDEFGSGRGAPAPKWQRDRPMQLRYSAAHVERTSNQTGWDIQIYPTTSPLDLSGALDGATMRSFHVKSGLPTFDGQAVTRAKLAIEPVAGGASEEPPIVHSDDLGVAHVRLPNGRYRITASAIGFEDSTREIALDDQTTAVEIPLSGYTGVTATVTDQSGHRIPAKMTVYAVEGEHPDFGPDSTRTFIKNCVYSVHGSLRCPLDPGRYEIYFSHGPEYDSAHQTLELAAGDSREIAVQLDRVVDTPGWISAEFHSHSSPSGDNVSDQYGRVENLLCEHLEFAPCTEHNRISSYVPHLEQMGVADQMATCSGIELTGRPLPVNHQNAFPLHHHPHTQNGGGPRTDPNPVVQIERIAMWDDGSAKVVQENHPNLHQIYGDLDVDGRPDDGFRGMLQWMDVVEVDPLQVIFEDVAGNPPNVREMKIPIFQWMQLLNQGYRIPGVANTDAHYNHHGSGWLRNWIASATDDPDKISIEEMVKQAEAGHIVMSTGPFLTVRGTSAAVDRAAIPGDDLAAADGKVTLAVRVQCPNWLDVNRVQVFVNGRPVQELNRTRKSHSDLFGASRDVTKFDSTFDVTLDRDAHLIVATIGEGMTMQKEMGPVMGDLPPIAVSNPIFVDVDGDGFKPNGDELGLALPKL